MKAAPQDCLFVVDRIRALRIPNSRQDVIGVVDEYPIYRVRCGDGSAGRPRVLLSAGTHGDEPAGVEAVLRLLESYEGSVLKALDCVVFPCVNPTGYVHGTRENADGVDINRSFQNDRAAEARIVKAALETERFDLFIECHEDWESPGFYLFEVCRPERRVGPRIIEEVARVCPINRDSAIDGSDAENGIMQVGGETTEHTHKAMPLFVLAFHADHIITCETPTGLDFEQRVEAHCVAVRAALVGDGASLLSGA